MSTKIDPLDYVDIRSTLSDEERAIADSVRSYVQNKIVDKIGGWFENAEFPAREIAPQLGEIGLLGMHLEGYGCAGTSAVAYGLPHQRGANGRGHGPEYASRGLHRDGHSSCLVCRMRTQGRTNGEKLGRALAWHDRRHGRAL